MDFLGFFLTVFTATKILLKAKPRIKQIQGLILFFTCIDKKKCLISLTSEKLLLLYIYITFPLHKGEKNYYHSNGQNLY